MKKENGTAEPNNVPISGEARRVAELADDVAARSKYLILEMQELTGSKLSVSKKRATALWDQAKAAVARDRDRINLTEALSSDVHDLDRMVRANGPEVIKRSFVRAVMAYLEAGANVIRENLIESGEVGALPIELQFHVRNEEYKVNPDGTVTKQPRKVSPVPTREMLLLSLRAFASASGVTPNLRLGESGWHAVTETLKLRNDLMHPKSVKIVAITQKNLTEARRAFNWFYTVESEIWHATMIAKDKEIRRRVKANPELKLYGITGRHAKASARLFQDGMKYLLLKED